MKLLYVLNSYSPMNGCEYVRNILPARLLWEKFGYEVKFVLLPLNPEKGDYTIMKETLDWAEMVVFNGHYDADVGPSLVYLKGKKPIVYQTDDDLKALLEMHHKDILEAILRKNLNSMHVLVLNADCVVASTPYLAERLRTIYKPYAPVYHVLNHIDLNFYLPRKPHKGDLRIGWSGGSTHPRDLLDTGCIDAVIELQRKYKFQFYLQGVTSNPYSAYATSWEQTVKSGLYERKQVHPEVYGTMVLWHRLQKLKDWVHIPFYPVQLFPSIMREASLDIGLCPLLDDDFNRSRSCNKFYEYAALGTVTLASDVIPYTDEVTYRTINNLDYWYEKIEKLIVDKKFRQKLLKEQQSFVFTERNAEDYAQKWHEIFQKVEIV